MKQQDKYFTPNIEDIRVNYECERKINTGWIQCKMTSYDIQIIDIEQRPDWYRVLFLTKEQIEAERWIFDDHGQFLNSPVGDDNFHKDIDNADGGTRYYIQNITGIKPFQNLLVEYSSWDKTKGEYNEVRNTLFDGTCPSINEFRTLMKWLNIGI